METWHHPRQRITDDGSILDELWYYKEYFNDILEQEILSKLYTLPEETVLCPGHGGTTTVGKEKQTNPFVRG